MELSMPLSPLFVGYRTLPSFMLNTGKLRMLELDPIPAADEPLIPLTPGPIYFIRFGAMITLPPWLPDAAFIIELLC